MTDNATILIVEDSQTQATKIKLFLEKNGYKVSVCYDGEEAWDFMQQVPTLPSLVISDIVMPKMNGYELCEKIRQHDKFNDVMVMLLTALSEPTDIIRGLKSQADSFVIKPYNKSFLLSRIGHLLEYRNFIKQMPTDMGLAIDYFGQRHFLTNNRVQIIDNLLSVHNTVEIQSKDLKRALAAEKELKESEKRYRRFADNISETIWEIDLNTLQFTYVNPSPKHVSGFSDQEIKNSRLEDLFPPSSLKLITETLSEELTAEKSGFAKPRLLELEHLHKNGSTFWAEISARFVRNEKGHPYAIVGVTRDISDRKKSEAALKKSEEKYRTILENMEDGYFEVDIAGNFTFYNQAMGNILGYKDDELIGKNNREYMDTKIAQDVYNSFHHVYNTGKSYKALDWELIRKDGTICNVETSVSLLKDEQGNVVGFKGIARDITERKQNENALQESEARYRLLADNMTDNLWTYDLDTNRYSYLSPSVYGITGFTPEEAINFTLEDFMTPPSYEVASKIIAEELFEANRHYDPSRSRTLEVELHRKDGSTVWTEASVRFIYDNAYQPLALMGVTRDISKRKQAEEALRTSEEFRKRIFDSSRIPIVVMDVSTGRFIDCNPVAVEIYEFSSREEVFGKTPMDVSAPLQYDGSPSAEKAQFYIDRVNAEGSVVFEWRHQRPSGEIWDAEVHLVSFRDGQRELLQFFLIDITESKKAETALQESEKRYRLLADNISDNIWIFDLETMRFSYSSPSIEGITGFTEEEAIGSRLKDVMTPLSFGRVNKILEEEMAAASQNFDPARSRTLELEFYKKNGSTVWTETVAKFIYDQNSKPIALLGATRDISERKKLQDQLHKSQKMESLGLLAGGVAHDLNNVLSGIVSYPELLLMNLPDDSKLRKPLKTIMESGNRAAAIVQDLLSIARGVAIIKEPLRLNDLVSDYFDSPEFEKLKQFYPGVTFKTHLDENLFNINASDVHISKVLMNIIANAAEAVKKSGYVSLSTDNRFLDRPLKGYEEIDSGEYVVLSVADDGPGISTRDLQRIFEPFYTKKKMGRSGTGLGLSVVWNVIRDHKGYIDLKSDESGTLFELYFPISRDAVLKTDINLSLISYKGNGEAILVVDDIESQREISSRMLDMLGYKYKAVSSGEKAIEYLKQNTVDLILLDMIMDPGINGYETYRRIIKIHPGQKAIILSGFSETDDVKNTQSLGVGKYLKKPITLEKLGIAIKEELGK